MAVRDEFFWLGEMNKATIVVNSKQGLLPEEIANNERVIEAYLGGARKDAAN